jgi:hypothetical protein
LPQQNKGEKMKAPLYEKTIFKASCDLDGMPVTMSLRVEDARIPSGESVALRMFCFLNIKGFGASARKAAEYAGFEVYQAGQKYRVRPLVGRAKK